MWISIEEREQVGDPFLQTWSTLSLKISQKRSISSSISIQEGKFLPKQEGLEDATSCHEFPYDLKTLASFHSEASCFLFSSRLQPRLRIALHSCYCVHILFICSFLLNMRETLFLYILQGKWKYYLNRHRKTDLFPPQSIKRHCLREFHSRAESHWNWRNISTSLQLQTASKQQGSKTSHSMLTSTQDFTSVPGLNLKKTRRL